MRVSTSMIMQSGLQNLQRQQAGMLQAQTDIATGVRLRTADVDPVAFSQVSQIADQVGRVEQFLRNNEMAEGKIRSQETRLATSTNILQRVREISLEAGSILQDDTSRQVLSNELSQLRDALAQQINAKNERGEYVFSGTQANQQPFDLASGDDQLINQANPAVNAVKVDVGETQQVTINRVASDIFTLDAGDSESPYHDRSHPAHVPSEDGPRSALQVIDDLKRALNEPPPKVDFYSGSQKDVDALLGKAISARGEMGNDLNVLDRLKNDQQAWKLANEQLMSGLRDTNMPEAISRLNENLYSLQATQKSMVKIQGLSLFNSI